MGTAHAWDTFMVSLSEEVSVALSNGWTGTPAAQSMHQSTACARLDIFCAQVQCELSPILPTHVSHTLQKLRHPRRRRQITTTPRGSVRLAKDLGRGYMATKHQQATIRKLCLTNEGDIIGDDALQAYVRLFDRPLNV